MSYHCDVCGNQIVSFDVNGYPDYQVSWKQGISSSSREICENCKDKVKTLLNTIIKEPL